MEWQKTLLVIVAAFCALVVILNAVITGRDVGVGVLGVLSLLLSAAFGVHIAERRKKIARHMNQGAEDEQNMRNDSYNPDENSSRVGLSSREARSRANGREPRSQS